jgi:hypothetical protein
LQQLLLLLLLLLQIRKYAPDDLKFVIEDITDGDPHKVCGREGRRGGVHVDTRSLTTRVASPTRIRADSEICMVCNAGT